jgi:anaerobic magnesium-protoporphyrin IX monomethyl ester cyclase
MNVLLVNPPSASVFATFGLTLPPMGLLYLAGSLERHGHSVRVKDLQVEPEGLTRAEVQWADVVGITSDTTRIKKALSLARMVKKLGRTVVLGGPHAQFAAAEVFAGNYVDFVIKGEGDLSLPLLVAALERKEYPGVVRGLLFRNGRHLLETGGAELPDVEDLPFPARHLVDLRRYSATLAGRTFTPIVTSRGCPGSCSFCSSSTFFGHGWRARSASSVLDELEEIHNCHGFRAVAFVDDNFTLSPQRVVDIAHGIGARNLDLKWWNFSRVETIARHPEMVAAMASNGSSMVYLGVESGNSETLRDIHKRGGEEYPADAIRILHEHGIEVFASYILGNLGEDRAMVQSTIDLAVRLDSDVAQFSILTPYPGTELHGQVADKIFTRRWKKYDGLHLVFRHPRINRHLLQYLLIKAYVRFYRRSKKAKDGFSVASKAHGVTFRKIWASIRDLLF